MKAIVYRFDNDINKRGEATAFDHWNKIVHEINDLYADHYCFQIKDLREVLVQIKDNDDMADYLTWKWKQERLKDASQQETHSTIKTEEKSKPNQNQPKIIKPIQI
ncbi:MAG: hypothetical protein OXC92_02310 [Flavobacteriaceae bacterium]|nr:hypothetical protein [Flavobacteriaceae bacterium]MCY4215800.1 hypothetical protein [Flavobacteriaceae bacterium]MCY4266800.1 hypothetical protein [Flavobacteriaceae bacterium]